MLKWWFFLSLIDSSKSEWVLSFELYLKEFRYRSSRNHFIESKHLRWVFLVSVWIGCLFMCFVEWSGSREINLVCIVNFPRIQYIRYSCLFWLSVRTVSFLISNACFQQHKTCWRLLFIAFCWLRFVSIFCLSLLCVRTFIEVILFIVTKKLGSRPHWAYSLERSFTVFQSCVSSVAIPSNAFCVNNWT